MSYEQFVIQVEESLQKRMEGERLIYLHSAVKNNGKKRLGITFTNPGVNISPTIYMEEYYERYQRGNTLEEILEQIQGLYEQIEVKHSWEGRFLQTFTNVRERIIYQLVSKKRNEELLKDVPYREFLDLAVIFYVLVEVEKQEGSLSTMLIRKEHLKWWKVSSEELFLAAMENTSRLLPYEFSTMCAAIFSCCEEKEKEEHKEEEELYVLTNHIRNFGASAMLYPGRLEQIGDYLKQDFYVLPSSVHEVIILSAGNAPAWRELCEMVKEINETQVKEEEVLSDMAYYYDRTRKELILPGI